MKKIIFIDHIYHSKTRSSNFFQDILQDRFDLHTIFVDPGSYDLDALIAEIEQAVVPGAVVYVWQLDFLAPLLLAMNLPVVCSPMFDGSGGLPALHWDLLRGVRFVNFSLRLHEAARGGGAKSLHAKFFPKPRAPIDFGTGLRGFFWRRRPEHRVDLQLVDQIFGSALTSLHIHDVPDTPAGEAIPLNTDGLRYPVTRSVWFDDPAEMQQVMDRCNFYIGPRLTEGIGMGFLEAMASGMLVAANDAPTHDEYISNGLNGILFNTSSQDVGQLPNAQTLAKSAHHTVREGYADWLVTQDRICDFVNAAQPAEAHLTMTQARALIAAYGEGLPAYTKALRDLREASARSAPRPEQAPKVLLGKGFNRIEDATERYFRVRVVWTTEQSFTLVPLDDASDLELIFRTSRGLLVPSDLEGVLRVRSGPQEIAAEVQTFEDSPFFRVVLKAGTFRAYDTVTMEIDWPLASSTDEAGFVKKLGVLLCEDGVSLVQM
ncbi:glycosyltransferase [Salipiger aestuarii]|uniref:glycosyltransferase n=1 Tax=Salipiger aestuarii TaxID=568098 RepID=UPI00123877F2|nr:glycosyltransferase [Salipiger aestuarii]KAA8607352.1 hypothetical protein AL037_18950 [Salipiger aestuarii]